jgi:tRNA/rRNA methyltransferase
LTNPLLTQPPAIVLVRPQLGENIGKAARAMLNFGLTDLRLVAPRDGWPNPAAGPAASGADVVLSQAQVFDTVAEAVGDCPHVFATTVRKRGLVIPVATPEAAARTIRTVPGRSAILFGAERSGCDGGSGAGRHDHHSADQSGIPLAQPRQAVILVALRMVEARRTYDPTLGEEQSAGASCALEGLIGQLDEALAASAITILRTARRPPRTLFAPSSPRLAGPPARSRRCGA